ncbi:hypothetical protein PSTG_03770 [Puccinia striiformis f. sp. tritici PST-78]|uniref:Uncharacterized protein n=1 Tax=Puccinia striiformis f. sp. tritici PST-78 TaxID=1165861 RepID=A0A0L0VV80_9BASI|nr:hypothetical protein PSTG_03770 [Puccinia striiformis f. sp. tritici PST-78]
MDNNMQSVLTDLSSEHALSANNKDYPSNSELSEPPELNPISNIEDDTELLLTELSSQPALLQTPVDYDSDSTNSSDSSEEDVPLSSYLWTEQRRDFFPDITAETKEKKKQRRAERKFFKKFGGPKPSDKPIHPCNPTAAKISCAYEIMNDLKQFHLYSHGHACIFDKALTEDK